MERVALLFLLAASACPTGACAAGPVPDGVAKDVANGYYRRALTPLQQLVKNHPQDAEVQFRYGEVLLGMNKTADALAAMKAAVALDPGNGVYHRGLGEIYGTQAQAAGVFSALGLAKSSLAELQAAVQLAPDDVESHADLAAYYTQAPGFAGGDKGKARVEEVAIARLNPVRGLQVQAADAQYDKAYDRAEALLGQAVTQDKKGGSYSRLGTLHLERKRFGEAMDAFAAAAARSPDDPEPLYWLGCASQLGHLRYDEGIAALRQYLDVEEHPDSSPTFAWAHLRLADLYVLTNNKETARAEFAAARAAADGGDKQLVSEVRKFESRVR